MKIYTHPTKNDLTAWASIRLRGPKKIWGPGIDLRTFWKILSLRPWSCLSSFPPSSVEAERSFSAAGFFVPKLRSSLSDEMIDYLMFARSYFARK